MMPQHVEQKQRDLRFSDRRYDNVFSYAHNNPLTLSDPTGLHPCSVDGCIYETSGFGAGKTTVSVGANEALVKGAVDGAIRLFTAGHCSIDGCGRGFMGRGGRGGGNAQGIATDDDGPPATGGSTRSASNRTSGSRSTPSSFGYNVPLRPVQALADLSAGYGESYGAFMGVSSPLSPTGLLSYANATPWNRAIANATGINRLPGAAFLTSDRFTNPVRFFRVLVSGDAVDASSGWYRAGGWAAFATQMFGGGGAARGAAPMASNGGRGLRGLMQRVLGRSKGCFVAGTMVATVGGAKPIDEIRAGDLVLSADADSLREPDASVAGLTEFPWVEVVDGPPNASLVTAKAAYFESAGSLTSRLSVRHMVFVIGDEGGPAMLATLRGGVRFLFRGIVYEHRLLEGRHQIRQTTLRARRVDSTMQTVVGGITRLTLESGADGDRHYLEGTPEHPVFVPRFGRYLPLGQLGVGTQIELLSGEQVLVTAVERRADYARVFDLSVMGGRSYLIVNVGVEGGGILVHNSCAAFDRVRRINGLSSEVRLHMDPRRAYRGVIRGFERLMGGTGRMTRGQLQGELRNQLHRAKRYATMGPTDDVVFDLNGVMYDSRTGERIGELVLGR